MVDYRFLFTHFMVSYIIIRSVVMFFFIGGLQPRVVILDKQPRTCPICGYFSLHLKRIDHYLSLFFIPLFPIKRGQPFLECRRCHAVLNQDNTSYGHGMSGLQVKCRHCGRPLEPDFSFCPGCGKRS